jgi:hypothetical protein
MYEEVKANNIRSIKDNAHHSLQKSPCMLKAYMVKERERRCQDDVA